MNANEEEEEVMGADEALFVAARDVICEKDIGMNFLDARVPTEVAELVHYKLVEVVPT